MITSSRIANAARNGEAKKLAIGAAAAGATLAAAKVGWDRFSGGQASRQFRLREDEAVPDGLRRIASAQLEMSVERLEGQTDEDLGVAVHEARKSFKRLRATVRLARDELGDEVYRRENTAFRDAGRRLGGARDSRVMLETLDAMTERHRHQIPRVRIARLRRSLVGEHAVAEQRLENGTDVADVLTTLRAARARVSEWPLEREPVDALAPGFKRIYRRGRKAYRRARRGPSTENLHELRKRAKDLWYSAQVLRPVAPKDMKRLAQRAHELSNLIGEDHDLAVLAERANECRGRLVDVATVEELGELIANRRLGLQEDALSLAKRLYRKRPRKVARPLMKSAAVS